MSNAQQNELETLILGYFNDELDPIGQTRLAELLEESEEARTCFNNYMRLEGFAYGLGQAGCLIEGTSNSTPTIVANDAPPQSTRSSTERRLPARRIALGVIALSLGAWIAVYLNPRVSQSEPLPNVGYISRMVAADWIATEPELGAEVSVGSYQLKSGLVEFEFENGATVILEGPARFDVTSAEHTFLHHGRVRTQVPPRAYGFVIDSAKIRVVDLGTEFGMEVDTGGTAEVHVFDGELEVINRQRLSVDDRTLLSAGQAIRFDDNGLQSDIPADVDAFVDQTTLGSRATVHLDEMQQRLDETLQLQSRLAKQLKRAEYSAKRSPELLQLKKSAQDAKIQWAKKQHNKKLKAKTATRDKAKNKLNGLRRKLMLDDEEGKLLLGELDDANAALDRSKKRLAAARQGKETANSDLHKELRRNQKTRNQVRSKVRTYGSQLRAKNPAIRKANQQLVQARKQLERLMSRPEFKDSRVAAEQNRRAFLEKQRQTLLNDETIKDLREKLTQTRRLAQLLQLDIQQARQAMAQFAMYDDTNVSSIEAR